MSDINSETAGELMADLWARMAGHFNAHALDLSSKGEWEKAIHMARAHNVALWQATGEGECTFLKDLVK